MPRMKPNTGLAGFMITSNNNKPLSYFNSESYQAQAFANPNKKQRQETKNVAKCRQKMKQKQGLSSVYLTKNSDLIFQLAKLK